MPSQIIAYTVAITGSILQRFTFQVEKLLPQRRHQQRQRGFACLQLPCPLFQIGRPLLLLLSAFAGSDTIAFEKLTPFIIPFGGGSSGRLLARRLLAATWCGYGLGSWLGDVAWLCPSSLSSCRAVPCLLRQSPRAVRICSSGTLLCGICFTGRCQLSMLLLVRSGGNTEPARLLHRLWRGRTVGAGVLRGSMLKTVWA
jgi:hypothetical protein